MFQSFLFSFKSLNIADQIHGMKSCSPFITVHTFLRNKQFLGKCLAFHSRVNFIDQISSQLYIFKMICLIAVRANWDILHLIRIRCTGLYIIILDKFQQQYDVQGPTSCTCHIILKDPFKCSYSTFSCHVRHNYLYIYSRSTDIRTFFPKNLM